MESKIYVVTHKNIELYPTLKEKGYELINVGSASNECCASDNTGDNISNKNANYCELTAFYWIWKNTDSYIKGFCHYRRYLTNHTFKFKPKKVISVVQATKKLNKYEKAIIVPERKYLSITNKELYLQCGYEKDLNNLRSVIEKKYPSYLSAYDKALSSNNGYLTNMMIAKKEIYDSYCQWLFDVLGELEKITDLSNYSAQEARIYGYLSERLLDVWIKVNHIKPIEMQMINSEKEQKLKIKNIIKRVVQDLGIYRLLRTLIFKLRK